MSSLEALLPDDLEKHVQLNRARLNSYGVLGEEIKAYCECGGHATESADITRKTVGARRTPTKVVRKGSTNARMQRMLTILTRRNQQMLNQKLKSVDSAWVITTLILLMCKSLDGSRLDSTQVQERRHGPRVSRTERSFLTMLTSLSAQQLESLSSLASDCTLKVATVGESISEFEVFKRRCVCWRVHDDGWSCLVW